MRSGVIPRCTVNDRSGSNSVIRRMSPQCPVCPKADVDARPCNVAQVPLADATVGAATQHDAWCGAGVGRIFDDDDAVDDDGGTRAARIAVRVRVSRLVTEVVRVKNRDVGRKTLCALSPELRRRYDPGAFPDARNYGRRHCETYAPQASQPNALAASLPRIFECVLSIGTWSAQSIRASGHPRRINRPDT